MSESAIHEAGHVVMAQMFGVQDIVVRRNARRGNPGMEACLAGLDIPDLVCVLLAGVAAERIMAQETGRKLSPEHLRRAARGDLAFLRWLGIRVLDLERAIRITEELLRERWQDVLRTALHIEQAWGKGEDWREAPKEP